MKIFPISFGKNPLPLGVEIRYEDLDAEYLMHMLYFLEAHTESKKSASVLIPAIAFDGARSSATKLKKEFEKFNEGERIILGSISVYFLDTTRATFKEYIACIEQITHDAKGVFEWGEEHEFFPLYSILAEAERLFFPNKTDMH